MIENGNTFAVSMDAVRSCSLGQITGMRYKIGGRYRRNMWWPAQAKEGI